MESVSIGVNELQISSSNEEDEEESRKQHHIPHDLLTDQILSRLPIKTLLRSKSVSKLWYATVSSYNFANAHFKLCPFPQSSSPTQCLFVQMGQDCYIYCYDDDDVEIFTYYGRKGLVKLNCNFDVSSDELSLVGSCHGLVCLASNFSGYFIIWNPVTLQFRKILDPYLCESTYVRSVSWGFGYASSVDDYKVVRIIELPQTPEIIIHVFSLGTNEWRTIGVDMYEHLFSLSTSEGGVMVGSDEEADNMYSFLFETNLGVLVNETLHWIVYTDEGWGRSIVSFDLNLETFNEFPHLRLRSTEVYRDDFLCFMGGYLSTWGVNIRGDVSIDMLKSPGVKESISLFRDLNLGSCKEVVGFTRTGKFFSIDRYNTELGLVDPRSSPKKYTTLASFEGSHNIQIAKYVPSLISPFSISAQ